ncbi:MAG: rhodanese-like domain-containing protein [Gammaproteobacteria bacterium]|nr:rhodanese-like domain-containing protein [Gammaproteobacteria bacterium]
MEEFTDFAIRNYHLFIALAVILGMILWTEIRRASKGFKEITPAEAVTLINREGAFVLDVREANEFGQGSIINAKHVALSALKEKADGLAKNKDQPVLVFCKTGLRSSQACKILAKHSYSQVFGLKGGITAWVNDQLPVVKK